MSTDPKQVIKDLGREASEDFGALLTEFVKTLKANTPIKTGRARSGWREQNQPHIGQGQSTIAVVNEVPYIEPLDQGHSRQAPAGIVQPSLDKVFKNK